MPLSPATSVRSGYPLGLTGAVSATRYVGGTATVAPTTGTFAVGDFVVTADAKIWVCTVAGTPGTWVQTGGTTPPSAVLFDSTLVGDAAAIDTGAAGVAQTYTTLIVRALIRTTEAAATSTCLIRVNGNSGANYDTVRVRDLNATVSGVVVAGGTSWTIDCASANSLAAVFSFLWMEIPFYTATTALKGGLLTTGMGGDTNTEMAVETYATTFRSAAAITQISITAGSGNLLTGSRLQVVGSI